MIPVVRDASKRFDSAIKLIAFFPPQKVCYSLYTINKDELKGNGRLNTMNRITVRALGKYIDQELAKYIM